MFRPWLGLRVLIAHNSIQTFRLQSIHLEIYVSVNSKCHLCISQFQVPTSPLGKPPGNFFEVVKSPAPGQNFLQKHGPQEKETPMPEEYLERYSQLSLLIGVEILEFCRTQTLKRTERLSNYSLVFSQL